MPPDQPVTQPAEVPDLPSGDAGAGKTSQRQILASSAKLAAASGIGLLANVVRNKAAAVLLGSAGVALLDTYNSLITVSAAVAGLGIGNSSVRELAEASARNDQERLRDVASTIQWLGVGLGILGGVLLALLALPIAQWSFGDRERLWSLVALGPGVALAVIYSTKLALLQGLRRIGDMARMIASGALGGAAIGVGFLLLWRHAALVPVLLAAGVVNVLSAWWFTRDLGITGAITSLSRKLAVTRQLLGLGVALMASGVMVSLVGYLSRIIVIRRLGLDAAGAYVAAWALSGIYVNFVLQSMGADFYPRLSAVAGENSSVNRLVNQQTEVALLLVTPGIVATLVFAPLVVGLFYSAQFSAATDVLRWQVLGVFLRVLSWPMGFILMAQRRTRWFFWCELAANASHLVLVWFCVQAWGLPGAGIGFLIAYVLYAAGIAIVSRRASGFRWSAEVFRLTGLLAAMVVAAFLIARGLPRLAALLLGTFGLGGVLWFCGRRLLRILPPESLPRPLKRFFAHDQA